MEKTCDTCFHVMKMDVKQDLTRERFCRRYPPTLIPVSAGADGLKTLGAFPPVIATMTCGEWKEQEST